MIKHTDAHTDSQKKSERMKLLLRPLIEEIPKSCSNHRKGLDNHCYDLSLRRETTPEPLQCSARITAIAARKQRTNAERESHDETEKNSASDELYVRDSFW